MTRKERIERLARALGMTPTERLDMVYSYRDQKWWLVGCVGGDQPLPRTHKVPRLDQALEAVSGWLAPELPGMDEKTGYGETDEEVF